MPRFASTVSTMNPALENIVKLLDVEKIEENLYRGGNVPDHPHVFGGQVLAQAIAAADRTVEEPRRLHSLHAYFLRPGDWKAPTLYQVHRIRDGKSFTTRRVAAIQHGRAIFSMSASWHTEETGLEHAVAMPSVPPPQSLRTQQDVFAELAKKRPEMARMVGRFQAIDIRQVEHLQVDDERHPPYRHTWVKTADPLPDDPEVHICLLAYISDMDFMGTSMLPHGRSGGDRRVQGASLDHAMWFHRDFRADEWLLFAKSSPNASGARGFVRGQFFTEDGRLIATAAQECLIRPRD
jgi:acyl-CoA thioesterase II